MARKIRIAILYNEPKVGTDASRKYISENGQLQEGPRRSGAPKSRGKQALSVPVPTVDMSEIGVVEEMDDIKAALTNLGYKPTVFNVDGNFFRLIDYLRDEKPDLIFNLVESLGDDSTLEMNVAGVYELLNIPYTGAGSLTLGIALRKPLVKQILLYHGIRTPKFQVFTRPDRLSLEEELSFPLIVKPSREDASVGITDESVVYTLADLKRRVRYVYEEFEQPVLVEEYIDGRELNVALLGNKKPIVFPVSEIDFSGLTDDMHKIVSYEAKWLKGTVAYQGTNGVCPANIPAELEAELKETALRCYSIIGCRDYARVDFRLNAQGVPYVLEVNPNPDISDDAGFARSARGAGFTFPEVIGKIVEAALERFR